MTTKNKWFTTNLNLRTSDNLCDFQVTISPYEFESEIFMDSARRVAHELVNAYDNLCIAYSGGLDSEFVLKIFLEEKLPIKAVLVDTPFNQFELQSAYKFCQQKGIKPEILSFSKNEFIDKLKKRTIDRNLFSLLGGLPLVVSDELNAISGKLITGYGDCFSVQSHDLADNVISETLQYCEWDYYLDDYDESHPSGFFTYDIGLFHSLIEQISYTQPSQKAKSNLYKLPHRQKMFWSKEFYQIFREMKLNIENPYCFMPKVDIFSRFSEFKK